MNQHSIERLNELEPIVKERVIRADQILSAKGIHIEITQGGRSFPEQAALFAQGRETTAAVNALRSAVEWAPISDEQNFKVTNAAPGHSWHNFYMCVDVAPFVDNDRVPDFNVNHPAWPEIVAVAKTVGLRDGISWKDEPHLQPEELPVNPPDDVRIAFENGGLQAAWTATGWTPSTTAS